MSSAADERACGEVGVHASQPRRSEAPGVPACTECGALAHVPCLIGMVEQPTSVTGEQVGVAIGHEEPGVTVVHECEESTDCVRHHGYTARASLERHEPEALRLGTSTTSAAR